MEIREILRSLAIVSRIPVTYFAANQAIFREPSLEYLPKLAGQELPTLLAKSGGHAACCFTDELLCYGLVRMADDEDAYAVFGPVSAIGCDAKRARRILKKYGLPTTEVGELLGYFNETAVCILQRFADFLLLANYTINRETVKLAHLLPEDYHLEPEQISAPVSLPQVTPTPHDARAYEQEMYALLRSGRYKEMVEFLQHGSYTGNQGALADTMLRHQKNMVIASATLASRAAVEGGLDYDIAMTVTDGYIQKAELASDRNTLLVLHKNMLKTLTRMVSEKRFNHSDSAFVNSVVEVIEQHLTEPVTVQSIAEELGWNRCYISTQFKQETGINLHDFINRMKIDEATRLLVTTDRSIASIASLLSFCSPSHFQSIFKKITGMNPSKYREGIYKKG